jgi:TatD DNase family protein
MRGKPNYPAYVRHVAEFLAEIRGETFEEVAGYTAENFRTLFALAAA